MCNCTSGNPYSLQWLWISGSRFARPGMTVDTPYISTTT
jgi:hypothetical protein